MTRLILPFVLTISGGFAKAGLIDSLYGDYQVTEKFCQETDRWCAMTSQISLSSENEQDATVSLVEVGDNKNIIVNHLLLKNFEAQNPTGQGLRETFTDTNQNQITWESVRFEHNSETGLNEDVYKETFKLKIGDGFVQLDFSNEYIKVQGPNRTRIFKLVRIK